MKKSFWLEKFLLLATVAAILFIVLSGIGVNLEFAAVGLALVWFFLEKFLQRKAFSFSLAGLLFFLCPFLILLERTEEADKFMIFVYFFLIGGVIGSLGKQKYDTI